MSYDKVSVDEYNRLYAETERLRAENDTFSQQNRAWIRENTRLEARVAALEEALRRARLALEHWGPPDPHHNAGAGHVCDTECEEMYHYAKLMTDLRAALAPTEEAL